jgi:hypothetical protein
MMKQDPGRFGNHSLRRGYASAAHQAVITQLLQESNQRAGWKDQSDILMERYSQASNPGALAFTGNGTLVVSMGTNVTSTRTRSSRR